MTRLTKIETLAASLALLAVMAGHATATELAKQEVTNNLAITLVPGTSSSEQWARTSSAFDNPRIDDAGNVVFGGTMNLTSPGGVVTTANRRGVWYGGPGTLQLIARDGATTPTPPATAGLPLTNPNGWWLNSTTNGTGLASIPTISPNGTMFIMGQLNGAGATAVNNTAFWTGQSGSVGIVAQRGVLPAPYGVAPGTGGMAWNSNLNSSQAGVNNAGQVFFQSTLIPNETRNVISLVGAAGTVTATTTYDHGYSIGTNVVIAGATPAGYNGSYAVATVPTSTTFTYANATTGASTGTITSSTGRVTTLIGSGTTVTATTTNAHNYAFGQTIVIAGALPSNYNGTFIVSSAPNANTFTYTYPPTIRTVNSIVGNGTTVTATTSASHGFAVGQSVEVAGDSGAGYNGVFVITAVTTTTFTYANATTGASSGFITATVVQPTGTIIANRSNTDGLWVGSPSGISLVMQKDDVAPGLGDPDLRMDANPAFGQLINGSGTVAIITKLKLGTGASAVTTDNDNVLCMGTPGAMSVIARETDTVPGMGGPQYLTAPPSAFSTPFTVLSAGLSNDNSLYFFSGLGGSGVSTGVDDLAIFKYSSGTPTLVLRKGDAAPGLPGVTFSSWNFNNCRANNNGTLLLATVLTGAGITNAVNNESLWVKPSGLPPFMIAQTGTVLNLPDLPPGTILNGAAGLVSSAGTGLNNLDQVVFNANFAGPGITPAVNDRGVMAWDPVGGLMLVAQSGNNYGAVAGATQITPNPVINGEGSCAGFSDTGWLCLNIGNSNTGNYAVYRTKVVATGACCYTDGSPCQMTTQANCPSGNLWRSDLTSCPGTCPTIGKCCYVDGTCALRFQENCTGTSWTAGQDCTDPCPLPGACCDAVTGLCSFIPQGVCISPSIWTGGVTCNDVQCLGSCCDPAYGSCMMSLKVDCVSPKIWTLGGTCSPNGCVQPTGACCLTDGTCVQATPGDCDTTHNSVRWAPGACGTCPGTPALIKSGLSTGAGLSPDGQTAVSSVFHGDTATSPFHKYTRGTGYSELAGGGLAVSGALKTTNNATVVAADQVDATNTSGLSPAFNKYLVKRWTSAGGIWNFLGTTGIPAAANQCDFTINNTDGMSDDGRYILASGWSSSQCGPFRGWRFDSNGAGTWSAPLNLGAGSTQNRGYSLSGNGATIVGWDMNNGARKAAVWNFSNLSQDWPITVLDPSVGQSEIYSVNNNGTVVVGYMSEAGMTAAFGTTDQTPIRWTRPTTSSSVWTRTNLGGVDGMIPIRTSDDGTTIVGVGGTASDAWIWRPHMSAPMDLAEYLTRTGVDLNALGIANFGAPLSRGLSGMSRDGTVLSGAFTANTPCLQTGGGILVYLNGTGIACEPPRMVYQPVSQDSAGFNPFGGILNCLNGGSLGLTYQWQKEDPNNPGTWNDITDDNCASFDFFQVKGAQGPQLRLGMWLAGAFNDLRESWGNYRCVVTNSCGSVTTTPATIRMGGACCFFDGSCRVLFENSTAAGAQGCVQQGGVFNGNNTSCNVNPCILYGDLNCDNVVNGLDVDAFTLAVVETGTYFVKYPGCNILKGDFNNDTIVDANDIPGFLSLLTGP